MQTFGDFIVKECIDLGFTVKNLIAISNRNPIYDVYCKLLDGDNIRGSSVNFDGTCRAGRPKDTNGGGSAERPPAMAMARPPPHPGTPRAFLTLEASRQSDGSLLRRMDADGVPYLCHMALSSARFDVGRVADYRVLHSSVNMDVARAPQAAGVACVDVITGDSDVPSSRRDRIHRIASP